MSKLSLNLSKPRYVEVQVFLFTTGHKGQMSLMKNFTLIKRVKLFKVTVDLQGTIFCDFS